MKKLDKTFVVKLNRIKPIDEEVYNHLKNAKRIIFAEEGIKSGGVGECFASRFAEKGITAEFKHIAVDDEFVKQASVKSQLKHYKLDCDSIVNEVKQFNE